jgi:hypothetical protein
MQPEQPNARRSGRIDSIDVAAWAAFLVVITAVAGHGGGVPCFFFLLCAGAFYWLWGGLRRRALPRSRAASGEQSDIVARGFAPPPDRPPMPAPWRRWFWFFAGLGYLAVVALAVTAMTEAPYLLVFPGLVAGALFCGNLVLLWMTLWARRKDSRLGQFTIGSMLFLMTFTAFFFGFVRWLTTRALQRWPSPNATEPFVVIAIMCLVLTFVSVPFVVGMTDAVLWAAVWCIRRPRVRRWLRKEGRK